MSENTNQVKKLTLSHSDNGIFITSVFNLPTLLDLCDYPLGTIMIRAPGLAVLSPALLVSHLCRGQFHFEDIRAREALASAVTAALSEKQALLILCQRCLYSN